MGILIGISMIVVGILFDVIGLIRIESDNHLGRVPFTLDEKFTIFLVISGAVLVITGIIILFFSIVRMDKRKNVKSYKTVTIKKNVCSKCGINLSSESMKCPNCNESLL